VEKLQTLDGKKLTEYCINVLGYCWVQMFRPPWNGINTFRILNSKFNNSEHPNTRTPEHPNTRTPLAFTHSNLFNLISLLNVIYHLDTLYNFAKYRVIAIQVSRIVPTVANKKLATSGISPSMSH